MSAKISCISKKGHLWVMNNKTHRSVQCPSKTMWREYYIAIMRCGHQVMIQSSLHSSSHLSMCSSINLYKESSLKIYKKRLKSITDYNECLKLVKQTHASLYSETCTHNVWKDEWMESDVLMIKSQKNNSIQLTHCKNRIVKITNILVSTVARI